MIKTILAMNTNKYLQNVLQNRTKEMGINGSFQLQIMQIEGGIENVILTIHSLTQEMATKLFDIIDESHSVKDGTRLFVLIKDEKGETVDLCQLPNIFNEPL